MILSPSPRSPELDSAYQGWPPESRLLVEAAVAAHGGFDAWRSVTSIRLPFGAASGLLPALKGYRRTFGAPREVEVRPHERSTLFHGYPDEEHRGRFVDGSVSIESVLEGCATVTKPHHREAFRGFAKYRRWNHLDALYFFGYALWHYHVVPFTLGNARFVRLLEQRGARGVEVDFGADVETHCRQQRFFFGDDGRIARHDYVAEVIGEWARGCHFWEEYVSVGGLQIARRRRVVARLLGRPTSLTVLRVDLGEPSVDS